MGRHFLKKWMSYRNLADGYQPVPYRTQLPPTKKTTPVAQPRDLYVHLGNGLTTKKGGEHTHLTNILLDHGTPLFTGQIVSLVSPPNHLVRV